jgi:hypothetical protein
MGMTLALTNLIGLYPMANSRFLWLILGSSLLSKALEGWSIYVDRAAQSKSVNCYGELLELLEYFVDYGYLAASLQRTQSSLITSGVWDRFNRATVGNPSRFYEWFQKLATPIEALSRFRGISVNDRATIHYEV